VLSVDEKTQIQALERTQLPLPLREGRARRHTHDYKRHGVRRPVRSAERCEWRGHPPVHGQSHSQGFSPLHEAFARRHPRQELHIVLDNSSTHGTAEVKEWLAKNPRVHFHYTPTSASWLNQVEGFFGILGKQSLGVAHFPSKVALREHIDAYIAHWNDDPTPFIWTKPAASIIRSRKRMLDRISHAVHTAPLAKTF
jgi:transposase